LEKPGYGFRIFVSAFTGKPPAREANTSRNTRLLKCDPETPSGAPDDAATLLGAAKYQLKSIGQLDLHPDLEARAAGGIIDNLAINNRVLWTNDYLGRIGNPACRPHT
jgi:hypothetical protein